MSTSFKQDYTLDPGKNQVTLTILSLDAYFTLDGDTNQLQTFTYGEKGKDQPKPQKFTVHSDGQYVLTMVKTQYENLTGGATSPSYCHLYFKPEGANWLWSTDVQASDNSTIFAAKQGEHTNNSIVIQVPTEANPPGLPSGLPSLNSSIVFLLDKNTNGNLLFRGNVPLNDQMTGQSVDFTNLHQVLKEKYEFQTGLSDFPAIGTYILRDIAFLDPDPAGEGNILMAEIASFGATATSQVNQTWYPETASLPLSGGMLGQVANWDVEPTGGSPAHTNLNLDVEVVKNLSDWMNTPLQNAAGNTIQTVYYIHCSSGHDRTGMIAAGYLMYNYQMDLSDAYILGTTINKLTVPMGGNLIQNCYDVTSKDEDALRSRCFVAGTGSASPYNNTIVAMYNTLNKVTDGAFSETAISGDPAIGNTGTTYVHAYYPWHTSTDS